MVQHFYSSVAQEAQLQGGIDGAALIMTVNQTTGFPSSTPFTLVIDPDELSEEIVTVTSVAGNTLTILRGQDGTSALPHSSGAKVRHKISARDFRWAREHENAASGVHGLTSGNVVGTSQSQTLTNKAIDGAGNTFTNIPQSAVTGLPTLQSYADRFHDVDGYRAMTKTTGNYFGGGDFLRVTAWGDTALSPGSAGGILYGVEDSGALSVGSAGEGIYSIHAQVDGVVSSGAAGTLYIRIMLGVTSGSPFVLSRGREGKSGTGSFNITVEANVPAVKLSTSSFVYVEIAHTFGGGLAIENSPVGANRFELCLVRPLPE